MTASGTAQVVRRRAKGAVLKGLHAHLFRHTAAHVHFANGGTEGQAMELFGWRSRTMCDAMLAVTSVEHDASTGEVWVIAGVAYLVLWVVLLGSRMFFAYSATGWARSDIGRFFITNHLSFTPITPAFVLVTIGSIAVVTLGLAYRASRIPTARSAPTTGTPQGQEDAGDFL